jgi:Fe-S-cluster-containing dehydrogenase component
MDTSRRSFLKIGGICALGLSALPVADVLAKSDLPQATKNPGALLGQHWAMVVDMKKCWEQGKQGCVDCLNACHVVHNVPDIGTIKEEIKWIWMNHYENVFPGQENEFNVEKFKGRQFIALCNHCTNPPCVRVCPTKATFKRPEDGIVMMDFHRCIGCRYCMAGCPYGARSFNFREPRPYIKTELNMAFPTRERGVVEKCNFCYERLADGLLPACVEACKVGALSFGDLADPNSVVRKLVSTHFTMRRKPELGTQPNVYYIV